MYMTRKVHQAQIKASSISGFSLPITQEAKGLEVGGGEMDG